MAQIRTFVAVDLEAGLKEEIQKIQFQLKHQLREFKWVKPEQFHLTLKFLGDVEETRIDSLGDGLVRALNASDFASFNLNFVGVGAFPKIDYPRVIWLGIDKGKESLIQLQRVVDQELISQGFPREKHPYSPHLTLARSRRDTELKRMGERLQGLDFDPTNQTLVQSIRVMKSKLTPKGPIYSCLKEIFLEN